jgi:hypothetical protein
LSTSGAPLRKVVGIVEPTALKADSASPLALASMLQVTRNRRGWRVIARLEGMAHSKPVGLGAEYEIKSSTASLAQPGTQQQSDSLEFIPTRNDPDPVGLGSGRVLLDEWSGEASAHMGLELHQDILVGLSDLKSRFKVSLVGGVSGYADISLSFEKSSAPCDFGIGRYIHRAIVPPPVAAFNDLTATLIHLEI